MTKSILMLAHDFNKRPTNVLGWWMSEKLDGLRAFWDGGMTRGILKSKVPWANTTKDARYVNTQISTGLWSRYGHVIHAPDSFLNSLPPYILDGELYIDLGLTNRQRLFSAVKKLSPIESEWKDVNFHVFDTFNITELGIWYSTTKRMTQIIPYSRFDERLKFLSNISGRAILIPQYKIITHMQMERYLQKIIDNGGEGLIVKDPSSLYTPARSKLMLKVKPTKYSAGKVIGWKSGKKTDKGSKLLGKMGSLLISWKDITFEMSGFTENERIVGYEANKWAESFPGSKAPKAYENDCKYFKIGDKIKFTYRDISRDGIPVEARYKR